MAWILGETELGAAECELVELGLVMPTDTLTVSDMRAVKPRTVKKDTQALSETFGRKIAAKRLFSEAQAAAEAIRKTVRDLLAETQALPDALQRKAKTMRADAVSLSDALAHQWAAKRTVQETAALSESWGRMWSTKRRMADTASVADGNLSRRWSAVRLLGDAQAVGDARWLRARTVRQDSAEPSDALYKRPRVMRADAAGATDAFARVVAFVRQLADSQGAEDAVTRTVRAWRGDVQAAQDALRRSLTFMRVFADEASGHDAIAKRPLKRVEPDAVAVDDALERRASFWRLAVEQQGAEDDLRRRPQIVRGDEQATEDVLAKAVTALREDVVALADSISRIWSAWRTLTDVQGVADERRLKLGLVKFEEQASGDQLKRAWDARRLVEEAQAAVDIRRVAAMALLELETAQVEDAVLRAWSASRVCADSQAVEDQQRSTVRPRWSDVVAAGDARLRFGLQLRKLETQTMSELWSVALSRLFSEEQALADLQRMRAALKWAETQPATDSARNTVRLMKAEAVLAADIMKIMGKVYVVDMPVLIETFGRRWQAYRRLGDEALLTEALNKLFRREPFREVQRFEDALFKRPKVLALEGQRVRDAFARTWHAYRRLTEAPVPVERFGRQWRAYRSASEQVSAEDVIARKVRLPLFEMQAMTEAVRSAWTAVRHVFEWVQVRTALWRRVAIVLHDMQASADASGRSWRAMRVLSEPSYVTDVDRKWISAAKVDRVGLSDAVDRVWSALRRLSDAAAVTERRAVRLSARRADTVQAADAVRRNVGRWVADVQGVDDRPIVRAIRAVLRDAAAAMDGWFGWLPDKVRQFAFKARFVLRPRTAGFTVVAVGVGFALRSRTLPFAYTLVWEGERVLHMVDGEARMVRVRVEAAGGDPFRIDEASVEVYDERTNELVASGPAEISGNLVEYLFAPPAPGVYTLVFTVKVGPQTLKHRETVRVVE